MRANVTPEAPPRPVLQADTAADLMTPDPVSISEQATNKSKSEALRNVFARLRALESDALCLALR